MAVGAALRVDELLPREPLRQWVLRVPFAWRYRFAAAVRGARNPAASAALSSRFGHHQVTCLI